MSLSDSSVSSSPYASLVDALVPTPPDQPEVNVSEQIMEYIQAEGGLEDDTPLPCNWNFWVSWKLDNANCTVNDTQQMDTCHTMGEFWSCFGQVTTDDMPVNVSLHVFRHGIPPQYDHPENRYGGHFKIRTVSLSAASRLWVRLVYAIVREQIPHSDQIQGCSVVKKPKSTTIQIWILNSLYNAVVDTLKLFLSTALPQNEYFRLKFCPHKYLLRTVQAKQAEKKWHRMASQAEYRPTALPPAFMPYVALSFPPQY